MLPMITVSGTRATRRYSALWDRAAATSQWWQNPTLAFGPGYPQYVPSTSALVDAPPIQANAMALPVFIKARQKAKEIQRSSAHSTRGTCYKSSGGGCKPGYHKVGYDRQGNAICCAGKTGPLVRNPLPKPTPYEECRAFCYDNPQIKNCYATHCAWLKDLEPPSASAPETGRRRRRMRASSRRRMKARSIARSARAMVSVGEATPEWKKAGACCQSCHEGKACEGGCGASCTCGKEGNPSTVLAGDVAFSPPTTSRLLNRARARFARARPSRMGPKCPSGYHRCGKFCCKNLGVTAAPHTRGGRPETLADCLYLCGKDPKCRQDCFHKHAPPR